MKHFFFASVFLAIVIGAASFSEEEKVKGLMKETPELFDSLKEYPYKIAYETYVNDNWEIFVMNADGSNKVNLTNTPKVHEMYPHVSPDGTKIGFVSDEMRGDLKVRCVYYMNMDGTGRTKVSDHARQPCWSPDGETIAFLPGKYKKFQVLDFATKGIRFYNLKTKKIAEHPNKNIEHLYNLCYAANGKWFVATVHGGMGYDHTNLAIEVNGNGVYDLGIGGCRPDISPDGKHIAWGKTDNIIAVADVDFDAAVPKAVNIRDAVVDDLHVYHVDWSPDGKYLCYSRGVGGEFQENGPGTNRGIAELVGVRGIWTLCVTSSSGDYRFVKVTADGETSKESEWFTPAK